MIYDQPLITCMTTAPGSFSYPAARPCRGRAEAMSALERLQSSKDELLRNTGEHKEIGDWNSPSLQLYFSPLSPVHCKDQGVCLFPLPASVKKLNLQKSHKEKKKKTTNKIQK